MTLEEFIKSNEDMGSCHCFSEESLKGFAQRMLDASGVDAEVDIEVNLSKKNRVRIVCYGTDFKKMDRLSDFFANGFKYSNALLCEIYRLRSELRKANARLVSTAGKGASDE